MSSNRLRVVVLAAVLGGAAVSAAAQGNAEITYSVNGRGYAAVDGQLVDQQKGAPGKFAAGEGRSRWYSGGTGVARTFFRLAESLDQTRFHKDTDYVFEPLGSSLAARAVLNGTLDWAGIGRPLLAAEKAVGLVERTVAFDSLYLLVHPDTGVESLGLGQIAALFTGEITNWKDVGGADLAVVPFAFSEMSGLSGAFRDMVLEPVYGDDGRLAPQTRLLNYDVDVFDRVGSTPGAVGFALNSFDGYEPQFPTKVIAVNHIDHKPDEVSSGRYPLARPLNFVTLGEPQGKAAEFLDLLLSERLQQSLPRIRLVASD